MDVLDRRKKIGELGELVIMRGEERARTRVLLQMLNDGPGDGKAVERGRAAADFVEKDQARGSGVIGDCPDLTHLNEKPGTPPGEICASSVERGASRP